MAYMTLGFRCHLRFQVLENLAATLLTFNEVSRLQHHCETLNPKSDDPTSLYPRSTTSFCASDVRNAREYAQWSTSMLCCGIARCAFVASLR